MDIDFDFSLDETIRCRATYCELREGEYFGNIMINGKWAIVLWDGDDIPTIVRANQIQVEKKDWCSV